MNLKKLGSNKTELTINTKVGIMRVLFSYETPVAAIDDVGNHYKTDRFHSRTTNRHIASYLNGSDFAYMPQSWFDGLLKEAI